MSNDNHLAVECESVIFFNQTNKNLSYFPSIYNQLCVHLDLCIKLKFHKTTPYLRIPNNTEPHNFKKAIGHRHRYALTSQLQPSILTAKPLLSLAKHTRIQTINLELSSIVAINSGPESSIAFSSRNINKISSPLLVGSGSRDDQHKICFSTAQFSHNCLLRRLTSWLEQHNIDGSRSHYIFSEFLSKKQQARQQWWINDIQLGAVSIAILAASTLRFFHLFFIFFPISQ